MIQVVGEALIDAHFDHDLIRPHPGGGPYNTAVALARLGAPVTFSGAISSDPLGRLLRDRLRRAGVADGASLVDAPTPLALVATTETGDADYRFYLRGTAFEDLADLTQPRSEASVVLVGSLALALEPPGTRIEAFALGAARRCSLVLDPNVRPSLMADRESYVRRLERLSGVAAIVKLSHGDAAWLYPGRGTDELAAHLLSLGGSCVVITDGERGAAAWTRDAAVEVRALQVAVIDTVGAGDAFTAGLLAWLWQAGRVGADEIGALEQIELQSAVAYATAVGAAQCTRPSAWAPTADDVRRVIEEAAYELAQRGR
jgi:fructokinase